MQLRLVPLGYQQLAAATIASAAAGLTVPAGATDVLLSADAAAVRFRDDGTAPTSTTGIALPNGQAPFHYSGTLSALQFIAGGAGALLNALFYRRAGG